MALVLRSALSDAQAKETRPKRIRHTVRLNESQRHMLENLVASPESRPDQEILRAQVLLSCDSGLADREVADALGISTRTVERIRQRFVPSGLEATIKRRPQPLRPEKRKLDNEAKGHLRSLIRSRPPRGRDCWTAALLAESMIRRGHVTEVSRDTIRRTWARLKQDPDYRAAHLSGKLRTSDK
jgi:transposase